MANQPEQPNYDTGVYQIETTDPVDGGVGSITNSPLLNLANRTAYLKQHVDNLENGSTLPPGIAPLNSPAFTGTPTTPTPPAGDSSTRIANTIWTQGLVNGISTINCAGSANVVLTAAQAGVNVLELVGALTGNIAVIVPTPPGNWIVSNQTTGAYTVTVKTASGNGIVVAQGYSNELWSDGANVYQSQTDFTGITINGATVNTAPAGDQSNKIANTQFAYNLKNGVVTVPVGGAANVTLTQAQYGCGILLLTGALTGAIEVFVPTQGGTYVVANNTTGAYSLTMGTNGTGGTTAIIPQGQSVIVYCDGKNVVLAGAAASSSFQASTFTATAGQTTFNLPYTPGNILVVQNGATVSATNYTAANGANVVLNSGANAGDEIVVYAFSSFTVANAVTWAGGAMAGPLALHGSDTGVTPALSDISTLLATTSFVRNSLGGIANFDSQFTNLTTTANIPATDINRVIPIGGTTAQVVNLPTTAGMAVGSSLYIYNQNSSSGGASYTLTAAAGQVIAVSSAAANTLTLAPGDYITLVVNSAGMWIQVGGCSNTALSRMASMQASLSSSGYQKLPSGLIIQWGSTSVPANTTGSTGQSVTLPIAFPTGALSSVATYGGQVTTANAVGCSATPTTIQLWNTASVSQTVNWWAVGH